MLPVGPRSIMASSWQLFIPALLQQSLFVWIVTLKFEQVVPPMKMEDFSLQLKLAAVRVIYHVLRISRVQSLPVQSAQNSLNQILKKKYFGFDVKYVASY